MISRKDLFTPEIIDQMRRYSEECYPHEALAVITSEGFVSCENVHPEPKKHAKFNKQFLRSLLGSGDFKAMMHSHPNGLAVPSMVDMQAQIQLDVPSLVMTVTSNGSGTYASWGDTLMPDPLTDRPFVHGVTDCYELMRDFFVVELGYKPKPIARNWRWFNDGDWIGQRYERMGFKKGEGDFKRGAVLNCSVNCNFENHLLIYLGEGLVLNHMTSGRPYDPRRKSRVEPLDRWLPMITRWYEVDENYKAIWTACT